VDGYGANPGFGDWLALDGSGKTDGGTPKDLISTAFFARAGWLMADIAKLLNKPADAEKYRAQFEQIKAAFNHRYVTPGGMIAAQTQTAAVLALHFDLLPEDLRPTAAQWLVADIKKRGNHLATGFVGTPFLCEVLTRFGHLDVAYDLLNQKTWPSWLYSVTQGGTTIWERWNGWTKEHGFADVGMNSYNHYAYGAIGQWMYDTVAGINPMEPAYKKILIRPRPGGGLTHAKASLKSMYGQISSSWRLEDGQFKLDVTIPPNTTATIHLPDNSKHEVGSGAYQYAAKAP
jgi:alpha-L-rhamnosidase